MAVLAAVGPAAVHDLDLGLIRALGGVLCGLTLVIVASALKRLGLYADAYGFTWPRLLGFAGEVWLGLIFVLVLVAGVRLRAAWLPRATVAAAVGVLFALVAVNPEALMARTVLERYDGPYPVDLCVRAAACRPTRGRSSGCRTGPRGTASWPSFAWRLCEPRPVVRLNLGRARRRPRCGLALADPYC